MNKVSFKCSLFRQTTDKDGEMKLVLLVPKTEAAGEILKFFAENTLKPLQAALLELPASILNEEKKENS